MTYGNDIYKDVLRNKQIVYCLFSFMKIKPSSGAPVLLSVENQSAWNASSRFHSVS